MIEIPILGVAVFLFALIVGVRLGVPIISCYYSFVSFSLLYCIYMYIGNEIETGGLSLLEDEELIRYVIFSTLVGLLFFVGFYHYGSILSGGDLIDSEDSAEEKKIGGMREGPFALVYIGLLLVLLFFAESYGWHAVSRDGVDGIEASLFAYGKYFFVCMGLFALWCAPTSKKWALFILITQVVLMVFDGGRTTFFGLAVAYAWLLSKNGVNLKMSQAGYLFLFGVLLLATRAFVLGGDLIDGMASSVVAEGIFAGYTALQMGDYILGGGGLLYGLTYLLDPIIYILPKGMREDYLLLATQSISNYVGKENFAPLGGFFWIAETIANFGFFGGAIVGSVYGYALARLENGRGVAGYYRIFVIAAFGALLSKFYLALAVKTAIFYIGAAFIIRYTFLDRPWFLDAGDKTKFGSLSERLN